MFRSFKLGIIKKKRYIQGDNNTLRTGILADDDRKFHTAPFAENGELISKNDDLVCQYYDKKQGGVLSRICLQ